MSLYAWIERDPGGRLGHGTLVERDDEDDLAILQAVKRQERAWNRQRDAEERAAAEALVLDQGGQGLGDDWGWLAWRAFAKAWKREEAHHKAIARQTRDAGKGYYSVERHSEQELYNPVLEDYLDRPEGFVFDDAPLQITTLERKERPQ